jgi:hypothetical protein
VNNSQLWLPKPTFNFFNRRKKKKRKEEKINASCSNLNSVLTPWLNSITLGRTSDFFFFSPSLKR